MYQRFILDFASLLESQVAPDITIASNNVRCYFKEKAIRAAKDFATRSEVIFVGAIWHNWREKFILRGEVSISPPRMKSRPTRTPPSKTRVSTCAISLFLSPSLFVVSLATRESSSRASHSLFSWLPLTRGKLLGNAITFATAPPPLSSLPP